MPSLTQISTELAAVNTILAGMGENQVSSLDASESTLADKARAALGEASLSIQNIGWYWNMEDNYPLQLSSEGFIILPDNTLKVNEARWGGGTADLVHRGNRLYNRTDHTYTFTSGPVAVDLVVFLEWDELPTIAKQAIYYLATRRFQMRELTSAAIDRAIADDFDAALASLRHAEDQQGPANIFADTTDSLGLTGTGIRRRS